jgi:hypothetical protein
VALQRHGRGRLSDINSGAAHANPSYMTVFNDRLYFSATSSDGTGTELWHDGREHGDARLRRV